MGIHLTYGDLFVLLTVAAFLLLFAYCKGCDKGRELLQREYENAILDGAPVPQAVSRAAALRMTPEQLICYAKHKLQYQPHRDEMVRKCKSLSSRILSGRYS